MASMVTALPKRDQTANLREAVSLGPGARIDRESGIIRGVRILGPKSRNGRKYLREAVQAATPLYEGAKVYLNHGKEVVRQVADRWGQVVNVAVQEDGGLAGDLKYNKKHRDTEAILEAIEQFNDFGLSHDVEAILGEDTDGSPAVKRIVSVNSVDLVEKPATTNNLFEHQGRTMKRRNLLALLREHRQEVPEANGILLNLAEMADNDAELTHAMKMDDMDVEVPEASPAGDQVKAGIKAAIMAILDEEGDDVSTMLSKVRALLQAKSKVTGDGGKPAGGGDSSSDSEEGDEEMKEQLQKLEAENAQLKEELAEIKEREACEDLLKEHKLEATQIRVRALSAIKGDDQEDARKALVESWNDVGTPAPRRPERSAPKYGQRVSEGRTPSSTMTYQEIREQALAGSK